MPLENFQPQPYQEPLRSTLARTFTIALLVGTVLAFRFGSIARWPIATLLMLWPAFGGHWVEVFFLNVVRARIPATRAVQVAARIAVWFLGGAVLTLGMNLTAAALAQYGPQFRPPWWVGGIAFIGIELITHLVLRLRGLPNFYNGRG